MINKLLGFRRASHEDVPDEIVLNLSHKLKDWIVTSDVISPIWANLISKYDSLNPNRWDDNKKIKSELEAFYTSGLSDGADVGIEMKKISTKLKYYFRGRRRYKVINNLLKFMQDKGANCAYSIDILTLQKESGRPWLQKINGDYYNPELFDHLLFYFYIHEEIKKNKNIIFIGDGAGHLSKIILSLHTFDKAIFIDFPNFLAKQYVQNYHTATDKIFITPSMLSTIKFPEDCIIINQDSFSEMPVSSLSEYCSLITSGYVDRVFSYNKFDHTNGHSNFTKILTDSGLYSSALTPSPFRDGYYLEIYNRV